MQIHNLVQGTPEWHQFRLEHNGASEAAAMLGLSPVVKRTELLHMKHTGNAKEFSDWVQANILDYGHEVEASARPIVEDQIGEDLYPVTCSDDKQSASCDGLTMSEETVWEHKQWNEALAASVKAGIVPDTHMPQCQQELMVTGAKKCIFTVSDGTSVKMVSTEVPPSQAWFDRIRAGWAQFDKDLAEYVPVEYQEKPIADAIMQLPALAVQIRGEVVLSNLPQFKVAAVRFIESIKTDLETDEDFSNAEATVKFCEKAEKDLELTKSAALGQTASIDELMKTIDFIQEQLRSKRLMLSKLVTTKKTSIKENAMATARDAYAKHIESLEQEVKPIRILCARPDFAGAAKNKRTLASLHDAINTELANAKIVADAVAKDIRSKLAWCKANAEGYGFLFKDMQHLVDKAEEDFQLVVTTRIAEHKKAEEEKLETQRAEIRKQEEEKARAAVLAEQPAATPSVPAAVAQPPIRLVETPLPVRAAVARVPAQPAWEPETPPSLRLGQIGDRLGFSVTADFLRTLGFEPAGRERSSVLFHETDFDRICVALINHVNEVRQQQLEAA